MGIPCDLAIDHAVHCVSLNEMVGIGIRATQQCRVINCGSISSIIHYNSNVMPKSRQLRLTIVSMGAVQVFKVNAIRGL